MCGYVWEVRVGLSVGSMCLLKRWKVFLERGDSKR